MTEVFGQAIKITAEGLTPLAHVQALIKTFVKLEDGVDPLIDSDSNTLDRKWELQGYDYDNGILLIKCLTPSAVFDPTDPAYTPYYSQIIIKSFGTTNILIGYDPMGGIEPTEPPENWGVTSKSASFSSFKRITGIHNWSSTNSTLYLTYYDDAITIFIPGLNVISWAAHVGKIYLPDNKSDLKIGIDGSGIIVGRPSTAVSSYAYSASVPQEWLRYQTNSSYYDYVSCIKTGITTWSTLRANFDPTGTNYTSDVNGKTRLVPYTLSGHFPLAGEVGRTKYLRAYKVALPNLTLLESATVGSKQAWLGWIVTANTNQKIIMLWCKKNNIANIIANDLPTPPTI